MWLDNLRAMKEQSGMTTKEISKQSGIPEPTLEKLFAGATKDPKLPTMQKLVHFFGYTLDDLDDAPVKIKKAPLYSSEALRLAGDYDWLDGHGKQMLRLVADEEKARLSDERVKARAAALQAQQEQPEADNLIYIFPGYSAPMSAGTGQPAGDEYAENYRLIKEPPRRASYIAPVSGDSMEPTYHDGDRLFIRACEEIEPGQIGVFLMDGQQWVKELGDGILISHNPKYAPIPMRDDIKCQGLVLGVCDDNYFE